MNEAALADEREKIVAKALKDVNGMTLSVIYGGFPREVLANQNLAFTNYQMPARRNSATFYDANTKRPAAPQQGLRFEGTLSFDDTKAVDGGRKLAMTAPKSPWPAAGLATLLSVTVVGLVWFRRRGMH